MESSRVDWPVKSRVDRSSRSYVFEVEPVDFQHLRSKRNRFGNHLHHAFVSEVFKAGSEDDVNWETFLCGRSIHARCRLMFGNTSDPSTVSIDQNLVEHSAPVN